MGAPPQTRHLRGLGAATAEFDFGAFYLENMIYGNFNDFSFKAMEENILATRNFFIPKKRLPKISNPVRPNSLNMLQVGSAC